MNDEEFERLVRSSLRLERPPEVPEEELEEFLDGPADLPPETAGEVRARFLRKVFRKLHPRPVWLTKDDKHLGPWLKAARESARLPVEEIAAAIEEPAAFVESLEGGATVPWEVNPDSLAKLMIIYNLHLWGVRSLVREIEGATRRVAPPAEVEKPPSGRISMAIEPSGSSEELTPVVADWLEDLRKALSRRKERRLYDLDSLSLEL
jgi:hypothetical protein